MIGLLTLAIEIFAELTADEKEEYEKAKATGLLDAVADEEEKVVKKEEEKKQKEKEKKEKK